VLRLWTEQGGWPVAGNDPNDEEQLRGSVAERSGASALGETIDDEVEIGGAQLRGLNR
jgi:hypothetical protein